MAWLTLDQVKTYLRIPSSNTTQDALLTMLIGDSQAVIEGYTKRRFDQDVYTEYYTGNGSRFIALDQRPVLSIINVWVDYNGYFNQGVNSDGTPPYNDATTLQAPGTYFSVLDKTIIGPAPAAWSSATAYLEGQLVTSGGLYYSCILANTNQVPPNSTYWSPGMSDLVVSQSGLLARVNYNWPDLWAVYLPGSLSREQGQVPGNIRVQYIAGYPVGYIPGGLIYASRLLISQMRQTASRGVQVQSESVTDYTYSLMNPSPGQPPAIGTVRQILNKYREVPGLGGDLVALPGNQSGGWR